MLLKALSEVGISLIGNQVSPSTIFAYPIKLPILIKPNVESNNFSEQTKKYHRQVSEADRALRSTIFILNTCRSLDWGIQPGTHATTLPRDPTPQIGIAWSISPSRLQQFGPELSHFELNSANKLLGTYANFKNPTSIDIPLERLTSYMSGSAGVDKAIDLRVLMESFFLTDKGRNELTYRLSTRSARFFGEELTTKEEIYQRLQNDMLWDSTELEVEKRRKIKNLFTDVYSLCSNAIHSGKFSPKPSNLVKLNAVGYFMQQAIRDTIVRGETINWEEFELM